MKKPSIKTLSRVFSDPAAARKIFDMCHAELSTVPRVAEHMRSCYHKPSWVYCRMLALNDVDPSLHGVESIETAAGGEYAEYINTGDSYTDTVIYWRGAYRVQSVGDFIERSRVRFA